MAEDLFNITVNGDEHEIKMTFGLLNNLCRKVGDIEAAAVIALDTNLRDAILIELLSKRDSKGKILEPIDLDSLEADPDSIIDRDHISRFAHEGGELLSSFRQRWAIFYHS